MQPESRNTSAACERVLGRLPELTDGALLPLEQALDHGHLEACASCARELASWQDFHDSLCEAVPRDGALDPELFHGLEQRLAAVVVERQPAEASRTRMLTSLVGAAASLVVLFGLEALGAAMGDEGSGPLLAPTRLESGAGEDGAGDSTVDQIRDKLDGMVMDLFPSAFQEEQ